MAHTEDPNHLHPVLPRSTQALLSSGDSGTALGKRHHDLQKWHPGLQLDKLSPVGIGSMEAQKGALQAVVQTGGVRSFQDTLTALNARRKDMLDALGAWRLPMKARGSLTLHLSRSGALENAGIALHPVYGFVYLPGSGIKGLTRAWAETVWAPVQTDQDKAWKQIEEAFGWGPRSEDHKKEGHKKDDDKNQDHDNGYKPGWRPSEIPSPKGASAGRLVFHDAWPQRWPSLILDVANNHHRNYYEGKDAPGDWEEPNLIYFLAISAGEQFEFAIADRKGGESELLALARDWLRDALTVEGAGAKTAAGYGRFEPVEGEPPPLPPAFSSKTADFSSKTYDLRLASPAFLAGANQKKEDCDLRPATLRGLLRWWWRTMHAAHINPDALKKLETAVWGDAQSGSPVRISVDFVEGGEAGRHPDKNDQEFLQRLEKPDRKRKMTQGLFYASYGMAEEKKGPQKRRWDQGMAEKQNDPQERRWYRPEGCVWRVTLTARCGRFADQRLSAEAILKQATAALWLLAKYGGVGSRSRKGFGSFDDLDVSGISSRRDCIGIGADFRNLCGLNGSQGKSETPALDDALILPDQPTRWTDPWYALDRTGELLQGFAKRDRDDKRIIALGLPRSVGVGPNKRSLKAVKGTRHASPALWSLTTKKNAELTVRLIAFPAANLPDKDKSEKTLNELYVFATKELSLSSQKPGPPPPKRTPDRGRGSRHPTSPPVQVQASAGPKSGDRVTAELLEERNKKGGWKARHVDSGREGSIQDSDNVPADAKAGKHVELTVASENRKEMHFTWAEPKETKEPKKPKKPKRPKR